MPVGMTLLAGGLAPYVPAVAGAVWWAGVALLVAFQVFGLWRVATARIELAQVNPGWLILFVGGIVVPSSGLALGNTVTSTLLFTVSAAVSVFLMGLLAFRALAAPPLPDPLGPCWFIVLVPPSLVYAHGAALYRLEWLEGLFFVALALLVVLLVYARNLPRWPFGPPWWSLTFPLDAFAYAAARYAQEHPEPVWRAVAGAGIVLATLAVAMVMHRTLRNWRAQFRPRTQA
jgi:tellurite resistance protein TehA-like permease